MTIFKVWAVFFLYSVGISVFIQFVLLLYVFPILHAGDGLLIGGDWNFFHRLAVNLADQINQHGWSEWLLRPGTGPGQSVAGIAAAIYVITGVSKPYVLIPLHSLLHSLGAVVIVYLLEIIGVARRYAVVSALPFLIFPTAMLWYTQMHKDTYYIAGLLLCLFGWVKTTQVFSLSASKYFNQLLVALVSLSVGVLLIWTIRPYSIEILKGFALLMFLFAMIFFMVNLIYRRNNVFQSFFMLLIFFSTLFMLNELSFNAVNVKIDTKIYHTPSFSEKLVSSGKKQEQEQEQEQSVTYQQWETNPLLHAKLNDILERIYNYRVYFYYQQQYANTTFDQDKQLNSFSKMAMYIPRAMQVGFLAPFPNSWLESGSTKATTIMRRVSGIEMIIIYLLLPAILLSLFVWRRKIEYWMMITFSWYYIMVPVYALPNVGTIQRYRYAPLMLLVALGIAALFFLLKKKKTLSINNRVG